MKRTLVAAACGAAAAAAVGGWPASARRRSSSIRPTSRAWTPRPRPAGSRSWCASPGLLAGARGGGRRDFETFRERLTSSTRDHRVLEREVLGDGALLYRWRAAPTCRPWC